MNDDDLRQRMGASLDQPVPMTSDAQARVEAAMLAAFDDAAVATAAPAEDDVIVIDFADAGQRGRPTLAPRLLVMAAAAIVIAVAVALLASLDGETDTSPAEIPTTTTTTPNAAPLVDAEAALLQYLGYAPFENAEFDVLDVENAGFAEISITDRVSVVSTDGARVTADVRRNFGTMLGDLTVVVGGDGTLVVPIEFIDPRTLDGTCSGGAISLVPTAVVLDQPECGGTPTSVEVSMGDLADVQVRDTVWPAQSIDITFAPTEADLRQVRLWFGEPGLLQIDLVDLDRTYLRTALSNEFSQEES